MRRHKVHLDTGRGRVSCGRPTDDEAVAQTTSDLTRVTCRGCLARTGDLALLLTLFGEQMFTPAARALDSGAYTITSDHAQAVWREMTTTILTAQRRMQQRAWEAGYVQGMKDEESDSSPTVNPYDDVASLGFSIP